MHPKSGSATQHQQVSEYVVIPFEQCHILGSSLFIGNFKFNVNRCIDDIIYWKCNDHKCNVRDVTDVESAQVKVNGTHQHDCKAYAVEKDTIRDTLKKKAEECPSERPLPIPIDIWCLHWSIFN